jgi:hypothetical protein
MTEVKHRTKKTSTKAEAIKAWLAMSDEEQDVYLEKHMENAARDGIIDEARGTVIGRNGRPKTLWRSLVYQRKH